METYETLLKSQLKQLEEASTTRVGREAGQRRMVGSSWRRLLFTLNILKRFSMFVWDPGASQCAKRGVQDVIDVCSAGRRWVFGPFRGEGVIISLEMYIVSAAWPIVSHPYHMLMEYDL